MKKVLIGIILSVILLTSLACQLSVGLPFQQQVTPVPTYSAPILPTPIPGMDYSSLNERDAILTQLYLNVNPGVVTVRNYNAMSGSEGSGFVYDTAGHIVTNYHVVENADDLEVNFPSGFKTHATIIGTDLDSDLAVLELKTLPPELRPLPLGDPAQIRVGQTVIAIGNPFGFSSTMTVGVISAKGRVLDSLRQTEGGTYFSAGDMIQTDAAINPGNSGGPLLNLNGEVIGVNRAIYTDFVNPAEQPVNSGVGFAISVSIVRQVVPSLIEKGYYDYPYIGITSREQMALVELEALGLPQMTGAYVLGVASGGPAERAGIRAGTTPTSITGLYGGGDLIIEVDQQPVIVFGDMLTYLITQKHPGDTVVLTVLRNGERKEVPVTLAKRP